MLIDQDPGFMKTNVAGEYLAVFADKEGGLSACVRHISMRSMDGALGGEIRVGKQAIACRGAYGNNGGALTAEDVERPDLLTKLPPEVAEKFKADGGKNSISLSVVTDKWGTKLMKGELPDEVPSPGAPIALPGPPTLHSPAAEARPEPSLNQ